MGPATEELGGPQGKHNILLLSVWDLRYELLDRIRIRIRSVRRSLEERRSDVGEDLRAVAVVEVDGAVTVKDGTVTVRDHGPGIASADLPHVFDRFYRAARARKLPGSGLGLAIVRQVAEAHGGTVTAEHAAGGGSIFILRLPVHAASMSLDSDASTVGTGLRPRKVHAKFRARSGPA